MKTNILRVSATICAFLLILTAICTTSCKQPGNCTGNVTVYDSTGKPLPNSVVTLYRDTIPGTSTTHSTNYIIYTGTTNSNGFVQFTIPLPAVWTVRAAWPNNKNVYVKGVLILNNPGTTASVSLSFQP